MKINLFKNDYLKEGMLAHEYADSGTRQLIQKEYRDQWAPRISPLTNPELYDPLAPPLGWAYDPYYACWIKL